MGSIEDAANAPEPPVILIAGPTGVGKSALALDLAEALGAEIISADSRQVYRGLEIGTAQPTREEQGRVPHHLVGFLKPDEPFSAARFVDLAEYILHEIATSGRVALLVGGTHHYVRALLDRLALPRVAPRWKQRNELERHGREGGAAHLHARLAQLDPAAAAVIPSTNVRRVVRALEVIQLTGQPFSEVGRSRGAPRPALRLAITMPREQLYARIDQRVDQMLKRGWLEEVRALLANGYSPELPALTSTGYRELIRHLRGELPVDDAVRQVKYSTHAYVRRQYAWLRRDGSLEWFEQGPTLFSLVLTRALAYLAEEK